MQNYASSENMTLKESFLKFLNFIFFELDFFSMKLQNIMFLSFYMINMIILVSFLSIKRVLTP